MLRTGVICVMSATPMKGDHFYDSLFILPHTKITSEKGSTLKGKNLVPKGAILSTLKGKNLLPMGVNSFLLE